MDLCPGMTRRDFLTGAVGLAAGAVVCRGGQSGPLSPPTAPLAMWALTGMLPSDEIRRQLDLFRGAGWGVVLYPRWGLEVEYLSDAWFERVRYIVSEAAAREIEVWLYDEFTWPSGQAKGRVAEAGGRREARVLRVGADGRCEVAALPGTAGLLDIAATREFLRVTHEGYAKAIGDFFGHTVRAVFTDEPSLPQQHHGGLRGPGDRWAVPWSEPLGAALGGDFPARIAAAKDPGDPRLWAPYWAAFADVFESQWVKPIADWCAANRLLFTGHLLGEGGLGSQVASNGSLARQLAHFGIPGIDEIRTRVGVDDCEALTLASISRFPGRERMAEVYALGPPSLSMDTMRRMVDLLATCGVDRYVMAICPFDFRGSLLKREYFGVAGIQQPWFREAAKIFAEHVAEAAVLARGAEPLPIDWPSDEALWAVAGPDPAKSVPLREWTDRLVRDARKVLRDRLECGGPAGGPLPSRLALAADWKFRVAGPNSLRLDSPELTLDFVPGDAEISVQRQLVSALRVNGTAVDLNLAQPDTGYDTSYGRVSAAAMLRAGTNRIEWDSAEKSPLKFLPHAILWGDFSVDGAGHVVPPRAEVSIGDWRGQGYPELCGTGCYSAEVEMAESPERLEIDSGGYPVRVIWNGKDLGARCWAPFAFDLAGAARAGRNSIEIRITGTLGHLIAAKDAPPIGLLGVWV